MAFNYAEKWMTELIMYIQQSTLTADHIVSNVEWTRGKTFHFTILTTSGYKNHSRAGGWNRGTAAQVDVPYTVLHDRDVEFFVDIADVDETNLTAAIENITNTFVGTQQIPETDAYFFSKVATDAIALGLSVIEAGDTTIANVYARLKAAILPIRRYGAANVRLYLSTEIMDLLERSDDFTRELKIQPATGIEGTVIETRVTTMDGVKLIEVEEPDRFYDSFDYTDGFLPTVGVSRLINYLVATVSHSQTVIKIQSIYTFRRGDHTEGDGDLYQNHAFWDTFNFPNAKTALVDSIFVSLGALAA